MELWLADEPTFASERSRLAGLCARTTGDVDAAEDLAQETLLLAWRNSHKLHHESGRSQWLSAIAHNVCLHWASKRGRELARLVPATDQPDVSSRPTVKEPVDSFDVEVELERDELVRLLDQAMALLPPDTRSVLVQRFVEDSPYSEIAARLGLSEGAVRVKLHRGKISLHRVLTANLIHEAAAYGLIDTVTEQETHIWCLFCGIHRLLARIDRRAYQLSYRCSGECIPSGTIVGGNPSAALFNGARSAKPLLKRVVLWLGEYYRGALQAGSAPCLRCGRDIFPEHCMTGSTRLPHGFTHGFRMACRSCDIDDGASLWHLALDTPAAQRFWQHHPRMRALPVRDIELDGQPVVSSGFVSLDGSAKLEILSKRDTYEILHVHGDTKR